MKAFALRKIISNWKDVGSKIWNQMLIHLQHYNGFHFHFRLRITKKLREFFFYCTEMLSLFTIVKLIATQTLEWIPFSLKILKMRVRYGSFHDNIWSWERLWCIQSRPSLIVEFLYQNQLSLTNSKQMLSSSTADGIESSRTTAMKPRQSLPPQPLVTFTFI